MNAIELLKVADAVDLTPDSEFDMTVWKCGSVGCAIGQYCKQNPDSNLKVRPWLSVGEVILAFETRDSFNSISIHFDIPKPDAYELFYAFQYKNGRTREIVSARIRKYVADNMKVPHEQN